MQCSGSGDQMSMLGNVQETLQTFIDSHFIDSHFGLALWSFPHESSQPEPKCPCFIPTSSPVLTGTGVWAGSPCVHVHRAAVAEPRLIPGLLESCCELPGAAGGLHTPQLCCFGLQPQVGLHTQRFFPDLLTKVSVHCWWS